MAETMNIIEKIRVLLFVFLACQSGICLGQTFTAKGVIHSSFFNTDETLLRIEYYAFEVSVSNCFWEIKLNSATNNSYAAKYDGENIYFIHNLSNAVEALRKDGKETGKNIATALVVKSKVPHDPFAEGIGTVWLAYASGCYFKNRTDSQIEPMFSIADGVILQDQVIYQEATWRLNRTLFTPTELTVFNDGKLLTYRRLAKAEPIRYRPPYENGFVIAQFKLSASKTIGAREFPTSAVFKIFGTKPNAKSKTDLRLVSEHRISEAQISTETRIDGLPPHLPGETVVTDSRFLGEKVIAFSYHRENQLPGDSDVRKLPEYQRVKALGWIEPVRFTALSEPDINSSGWHRPVFFVILVLTAILPATFLLKMSRRNKQTNP